MKKCLILALMAMVASMSFAQEKMKVVLSNGTTSEFEVKKIQKVYFEGQDVMVTTGAATNITSEGATISYTVAGATGKISAGFIMSTNEVLTYDNCQEVFLNTSTNGTFNKSINGLSPTTKYYYRAFAMISGEYYYGDIRSFTTLAVTPSLIYREPYIAWGATVSQTKNYMNGYTIYKEENNTIVYYGKYQETMTVYSFENNKLVYAIVAVETSKTTISALDTQLKENNYSYLGTKEGARFYISSDKKTALILESNEAGTAYYVKYYDYNWLVNSNSNQLFEEPYTVWGTTRSKVKSEVANLGYSLNDESTSASDNYFLIYNGKHKEIVNAYFFDSSQKLNEVDILFSASDVSLSEARDYLTSNLSYTYKGTNSSKTQFLYLTPDSKSYAIAYNKTIQNVDYTYITYISYNSVTNSAPRRGAYADGEMQFETIATPNAIDNNSLLIDQLIYKVKSHKMTDTFLVK